MTTIVRLAPSASRVLATTAGAWGLPCGAQAAGGMAQQRMAAPAANRQHELRLAARRIGDQRDLGGRQRERQLFSQWPYWPAYPGLAAEWR